MWVKWVSGAWCSLTKIGKKKKKENVTLNGAHHKMEKRSGFGERGE